MHGIQRVVIFCILTTVLPAILIISPLYLRNVRYADVMYKISDSDVIQIHKGQSPLFCEKHSLKMNASFNAFQMKGRPELSEKRRHITLKKTMSLPDDTLEYWGFYLFSGATVELRACSRYEGSKILVVKGQKIFNTCGILESNKYKKESKFIENQEHVSMTLQNPEDSKHLNQSRKLQLDKDNTQKSENVSNIKSKIRKRDTQNIQIHNPNTVLDAGFNHGGNAFNNISKGSEDKSESSFENNLQECYHDNTILLSDYFPFSMQCNNTKDIEKTTTLKVVHDVTSDGYYYYIFYSDNDFFRNDVQAISDIYKPTFQYSNISDSKMCLNKTKCEFDIDLFSDELVIVEVPTTDGLKNDDNTLLLISVCHPRMSVYIFFPVSVLLLILLLAFL